ncbi:ThiF family adenylyltransferase [Cupriavidus sp. amp6]|uniref:HesA/MoeB/ThiF family protein n=1 Tax=Cupriavidus sp. amp6 TaxID=388051 RepID=UPI000A02A4E2|nr:ThiF family adenylyltransferase [Cupriavidus sp. amp6]
MRFDRYQRHSLIDWFSQESLKSSRYAIVGCGAVGNEVAKNLALLGVGSLHLYDFDTIALHNLTRSVLFRESDVGSNKAIVAAQKIRELDSSVDVEAFPGDFWEWMTLSGMEQYAVVFCCVDNFDARIKLNQLCRFSGTNLVNAGIDSRSAMVEIFPFRDLLGCACYECNLPLSAYKRIRERYSCGWLKRISHVERKIPTTIVTSSLAAAHAVSAGLRLGPTEGQLRARRLFVDSISGRMTVSELGKNIDCACCRGLVGKVTVTSSSPIVTDELASIAGQNDDVAIYVSDPIIIRAQCRNCSGESGDSSLMFERASRYDTRLQWCPNCNEDSVEVEIVDNFSISELVGPYLGKRLPSKFVWFQQDNRTYVLDLEK